MSRIARPSEKIMAVAGIYEALVGELAVDQWTNVGEPTIVALINASVAIAMGTDTRDMGIMVDLTKTCPHVLVHPGAPDDHCTWPLNHEGPHSWEGGDHFAYPCDDCGRADGTHDLSVEH